MIWDLHCHLSGVPGRTPDERMAGLIKFADRMGIERLCVFADHGPTPEEMREENDLIMRAVRASHNRVFGYAYMNPYYVQACLDELNRCVRDGRMIGLKFQYDTPRHANSPELDPIIERAGELQAVVMHHTWIQLPGNEEDVAESNPMELAELARRHPSVTIICGHTGGNWELGIRAICGVKNLYADLCGSDPTSGYTEMAVRELGAERVMYGSDGAGRSFASQLGKVMGADIPDSTGRLILGGNLRRVLQPIRKAKGVQL